MAKILRVSNGFEQTIKSKQDVPIESPVMTVHYDPVEVGDLTRLTPVNSITVLHCLKQRYEQDIFYTRAGLTVVATNPFKPVPHLYNNNSVVKYSQPGRQSLPPHIYNVAEEAYTQLKHNSWHPNQSIVVSGESGAGKTVTAKHLMRYLTAVSNTSLDAIKASSRIEQRILDSNPILEAFGNAQTLRNHNSSRFGKYIQLQFQRTGQILGGYIKTYLLEKTRVVHQADGECNFHIFYQFLSSCGDDVKIPYNIASMEGRDKEADQKAWASTKDAMDDIGLGKQQQEDIFQILTAILNLGNVSFMDDGNDSCYIDTDIKVVSQCLDATSDILGINSCELEKTLTFRQITANHSRRRSVFNKPCTLRESTNRRDCLAKLLYSTLFDWLVKFINDCIVSENLYGFIGLLDIYGFECFTDNSLEQLCINYANEKLQQHFVAHFLRDLQEDYEREGVPWSYTSYVDNRPCLELLDGIPGVFALLNEECQLNRPSSDDNLVHRITSNLQSNPRLLKSKPGVRHSSFLVSHYAGHVQYNVGGLLQKNKDNVPTELLDLLKTSKNSFVAKVFCDSTVDQPGKKKKTVLSKFRSSMDNLMGTLGNTKAHYIRCIKPNTKCLPNAFDDEYVMSQLEACGVTETVEIGRQAFPARISYANFLHRFGVLMREENRKSSTLTNQNSDENKENEIEMDMENLLEAVLRKKSGTPRTSTPKKGTPKKKLRRRAGLSSSDHSRRLCSTIMSLTFADSPQTGLSGHKMGRTKIFLRDGQLEELESARSVVLSRHAFTIQCAWKRYHRHISHLHRMTTAAIIVQRAVRSWLNRRRQQQEEKSAALTIERVYLRFREGVAKRRHLLDLTLQSRRWSSEEASRTMNESDAMESFHNKSKVNCDLCYTVCHEDKTVKCEKQLPVEKQVTGYKQSEMQAKPCKKQPPATMPKPNRCNVVKTSLPSLKKVLTSIETGGKLTYRGLPYLEFGGGVLSRRHIFEGKVRFHTKVNNILKYAHLVNKSEITCSLTDCLSQRDIRNLLKTRPVY